MLHHIEFCLDEIDCEIDALLIERVGEAERALLKSKIADIRDLIAGWKVTLAGVAPAPATDEIADDLTLIRGIDTEIAAKLAGLGYTRFEIIASWRAHDIAALEPSIPSNRIAQQNWIEQAAMLATGTLTAHAVRVKRGDFACLVTSPGNQQTGEPIKLTGDGQAQITEPAANETIEFADVETEAPAPTVESSCGAGMDEGSSATTAAASDAKPVAQDAVAPAFQPSNVIAFATAPAAAAATATATSGRRWGRRAAIAATLAGLLAIDALATTSHPNTSSAAIDVPIASDKQ